MLKCQRYFSRHRSQKMRCQISTELRNEIFRPGEMTARGTWRPPHFHAPAVKHTRRDLQVAGQFPARHSQYPGRFLSCSYCDSLFQRVIVNAYSVTSWTVLIHIDLSCFTWSLKIIIFSIGKNYWSEINNDLDHEAVFAFTCWFTSDRRAVRNTTSVYVAVIVNLILRNYFILFLGWGVDEFLGTVAALELSWSNLQRKTETSEEGLCPVARLPEIPRRLLWG